MRRLVASGHLVPGAALHSVREVAAEHAVNPTTISKAYGLLKLEGLIQRNRGKPMTRPPAVLRAERETSPVALRRAS